MNYLSHLTIKVCNFIKVAAVVSTVSTVFQREGRSLIFLCYPFKQTFLFNILPSCFEHLACLCFTCTFSWAKCMTVLNRHEVSVFQTLVKFWGTYSLTLHNRIWRRSGCRIPSLKYFAQDFLSYEVNLWRCRVKLKFFPTGFVYSCIFRDFKTYEIARKVRESCDPAALLQYSNTAT